MGAAGTVFCRAVRPLRRKARRQEFRLTGRRGSPHCRRDTGADHLVAEDGRASTCTCSTGTTWSTNNLPILEYQGTSRPNGGWSEVFQGTAGCRQRPRSVSSRDAALMWRHVESTSAHRGPGGRPSHGEPAGRYHGPGRAGMLPCRVHRGTPAGRTGAGAQRAGMGGGHGAGCRRRWTR